MTKHYKMLKIVTFDSHIEIWIKGNHHFNFNAIYGNDERFMGTKIDESCKYTILLFRLLNFESDIKPYIELGGIYSE